MPVLGHTGKAAVRSLALKWIRIHYRCWQTGVAYDESKYLEALEGRGSPLVKRREVLEPALLNTSGREEDAHL